MEANFKYIIDIAYFVTAFLFVVGLKRMSNPATARSGNQMSAAGMAIAVAVTMIHPEIKSYALLVVAMVVGAIGGWYSAKKVQMTAMPQMVAIFNGMGGGAAALVASFELFKADWIYQLLSVGQMGVQAMGMSIGVITLITALIGSISFAGSIIAFGKLQELISGRPITFPGQNIFNGILGVATLALVPYIIYQFQHIGFDHQTAELSILVPSLVLPFVVFVVLSMILGIMVVLPIGGADMPVIIAILNSMTGMAAATSGFVLQNNSLIIAGALVGASGSLLTLLMAKAMNRSVSNVLFGAFGQVQTAATGAAAGPQGAISEYSIDDAKAILENAQSVIIVPGYGLAVAHGQHVVREIADLLADRGAEVRYAIHPVAGRMPGHMNVLLAEANVPYEQLLDLDEINDDFKETDAVLILGANDVVNPAAKEDPTSPIYGMPVLNVEEAKNVIVIKRSMNPGFAGIENALFFRPNTRMVFGDAKKVLTEILKGLKE